MGLYLLKINHQTLYFLGSTTDQMCTNVLYSGTMSAAVEGALEGLPSIGFSQLVILQMLTFLHP